VTASGASAEIIYGGFDIVDTPGAVELDYANVRGWLVTASYVCDALAFCSADKYVANTYMSIGYDGMQWRLAVPVPHQNMGWSGILELKHYRLMPVGFLLE
jgi:hypothetical protein